MSCSDKAARWNVLGVQGSLLSLYVDPIYYKSVIVGAMYHEQHLTRAVYTRISGISNLPDPYIPNLPLLHGVSDPPSRVPNKSPNHSVNWSWGDREVEVVNARTGKLSDICPSRVCKQLLFETFLNLWDSIASKDLRQKVLEKKLLPAGVIAGLLSAALAKSSSNEEQGGGGVGCVLPGLGDVGKEKNGVNQESPPSSPSALPFVIDRWPANPVDRDESEEATNSKTDTSPPPPKKQKEDKDRQQAKTTAKQKQEEKVKSPTATINAMPFSEGFTSSKVSPPKAVFPKSSPSPRLLSSITALQVRKHCTYGEVKSLAVDYQVAKEKLSTHFRLNWGSEWIGKPEEQDKFTL